MSDLNETELARWLGAEARVVGDLRSVSKFVDGQSNPTYRLHTDRGDFVLRRKPFGKLLASAHSVEREFRLIKALHPVGFPVPQPIALCTDASVIGSAFYVMEMVDGRAFWDGQLPHFEAPDRGRLYWAMIDTLALLHNISVDAVGLQDFGRPGNYLSRQVERWRRQYRDSQTEDSPEVDGLISFFEHNVPEQRRTSIIHGDFRIDNLIFDHNQFKIAAVLDWELSTLGDPIADLTYFALTWVMPNVPGRSFIGGLDLRGLGIPTLPEVIERYCAATAQEVPLQIDWYIAFNLFRSIGICQGVKKRMLDGNASSAHAAEAVAHLPRLITTAVSFAEKAGASFA
jgi:aminoglycoside phosphotransferase (APT) family kinase protein